MFWVSLLGFESSAHPDGTIMCDYGSVVFDLHLTRSACNRSRAAVSEWSKAQYHMLKDTDLLLPSIPQQMKRLRSARSYSGFQLHLILEYLFGKIKNSKTRCVDTRLINSEPQTQSEQEVMQKMYKQKSKTKMSKR